MKDISAILKVLRIRRAELGLSLSQISNLTNLSRPTICNGLNDKKRLSVSALNAIAICLGMTLTIKKKCSW